MPLWCRESSLQRCQAPHNSLTERREIYVAIFPSRANKMVGNCGCVNALPGRPGVERSKRPKARRENDCGRFARGRLRIKGETISEKSRRVVGLFWFCALLARREKEM